MFYITKKSRAFRNAGDGVYMIRRRSEGRLKTYTSATDTRAWCDEVEERRQHIHDVIKAEFDKGKCLGKYVPIETIIELLLALKNADYENMKKLLDMYSMLELTEDQKRQLGKMKGETGSAIADGAERSFADRNARANIESASSFADRNARANIESASSFADRNARANMDPKEALKIMEEECNRHKNIALAAIKQLENLQAIVQERDALKKQLSDSLHEIDTLKKRVEGGISCQEEIDQIGKEIEGLRAEGHFATGPEEALINKEIDLLKKYCSKLTNLRAENKRMLRELNGQDALKARVQQLETELLRYGDLPQQVEVLRRRSSTLDDVLVERDDLQQRLDRLKGLEEEVRLLKEKADRADALERELNDLRGDANRSRRSSEAEVMGMKSAKDDALRDLDNLKAERDQLRMKLADLAGLEAEAERLRYRAKEAEVLRLERDRLNARITELSAIESQYMQLLDKCRCLESIKAEKEMYRSKYEELLPLACEVQILRKQVERVQQLEQERNCLQKQLQEFSCGVSEQEGEIKRLVSYIDKASQAFLEKEERLQKTIFCLKEDLEAKGDLIAAAEEQLASVQDQLKGSINDVACEKCCLRTYIEELQKDIAEAEMRIQKKQCEITCLQGQLNQREEMLRSFSSERQEFNCKDQLINKMQCELEKARQENDRLQCIADRMGQITGDAHLEKMLKHSKCAVKKVSEALNKHYTVCHCVDD